MRKIFHILLLICAVWRASSAFAEGYRIDLIVQNDTVQQMYYLHEYYGYRYTVIDSAIPVKSGVYRFSNAKKNLPAGFYCITQNQTRIDFVVEKSQNFSIEVDSPDLSGIKNFKNSAENTQYQKMVDELTPLLNDYQRTDSLLKTLAVSTSEHDRATRHLTVCLEKIDQIKNDFIKKNPEHLMTLVFNTQKDVDVPNPPENLSREDAEVWQYEYYKSHFFDALDFTDNRLVRTPILYAKTEQFLNQVIILQQDTIISELSVLLRKAEKSKDNFQFLLDYLTLKYDRENFAGHDAVWTFLVEQYFLKGKADWASQATLDNYTTRLERIKPWLVGQFPPEIWYPDTANDRKRMTSLFFSPKPYTILIFWEPECPHCRREITQLKNFYAKKEELGFEIIAVARDPNVSNTKKMMEDLKLPFVVLHGGSGPGARRREDIWPIDAVPTIFILDKDKRIIAKKIQTEQIENFIKNDQK